jgi:hypothetical protein
MLSDREKEIITHALCGSQTRRPLSPYRNRFITGEGTDDFAVCEGLVAKQMMTKRKYSLLKQVLNERSFDIIYFVTELGAKEVGLYLPTD